MGLQKLDPCCKLPQIAAKCRKLPQCHFSLLIPNNILGFTLIPTWKLFCSASYNRQFTAICRNLPQFAAICHNLPQCAANHHIFLQHGTDAPFYCLLKTVIDQNVGQPFHWPLSSPIFFIFQITSQDKVQWQERCQSCENTCQDKERR